MEEISDERKTIIGGDFNARTGLLWEGYFGSAKRNGMGDTEREH